MRQLIALQPQMAAIAQKIYDEWDGESGGICDEIANEISGIIASNIENVELDEYGHEGDDHTAVIVKRGDKTYLVDIPYYVYEKGGGYSWKKIPNVKFAPEDVQITRL
jgi:hypothetical protein